MQLIVVAEDTAGVVTTVEGVEEVSLEMVKSRRMEKKARRKSLKAVVVVAEGAAVSAADEVGDGFAGTIGEEEAEAVRDPNPKGTIERGVK